MQARPTRVSAGLAVWRASFYNPSSKGHEMKRISIAAIVVHGARRMPFCDAERRGGAERIGLRAVGRAHVRLRRPERRKTSCSCRIGGGWWRAAWRRAAGCISWTPQAKTVRNLYAAGAANARADKTKYARCPGPLDPKQAVLHGLSMRPASNWPLHRLRDESRRP